jgi:hypothetical protein
MSTTRGVLISLVAAAVLSLSACGSGDNPSAPPATSASPASAPPTVRVVGPLTPADAQALATMNERVKEYVALHVKLERSLPKLPKEATPEQIDKNQRALHATSCRCHSINAAFGHKRPDLALIWDCALNRKSKCCNN